VRRGIYEVTNLRRNFEKDFYEKNMYLWSGQRKLKEEEEREKICRLSIVVIVRLKGSLRVSVSFF